MSTSSAAQLEREPQADVPATVSRDLRPQATSALKLQVADRLAAHRALRQRHSQRVSEPQLFPQETTEPALEQDARARRIAAAVAERYAQSQSYRAFLAAEAERAQQQAKAASEAALHAEAVAAAQQQLLSDLTDWMPELPLTDEADPTPAKAATRRVPVPAASVTIKLYEENVRRMTVSGVPNAVPHELPEEYERQALEEEIAWRQAPVFEEILEAAIPTTANLIEFPRQLVAPRKARPRLAEGPLREETEEAITGTQLRIFEVQAEQIATTVEQTPDAVSMPEWSSIRLSACTPTEPEIAPAYAVSVRPPLSPASHELRLMAAAVDGTLLVAALLGFTTVEAVVSGQLLTGQLGVVAAAVTLAVLFLLYQTLFFTLGVATPGMMYARIGLCTFSDNNPTRPAMRRRIGAVLLAACPLGLGFLWALLDEDGLGWHDRISRMYQRSY